MNKSDSQATTASAAAPWPLILLIAAVSLLTIAVLIVAFVPSLDSEPSFERGVAVRPLDGAPGGDAYVTLSAPFISVDDQIAIVADLGSSEPHLRPDTIKHLGRAASEFGETELMSWQEDSQSNADERSVLVCQGALSDYSSSGSGSTGCDDANGPVTIPHIGVGAVAADDDSLARVRLFDAPPEARWMLITTERGDRIVANVLHHSSYAEWLSNERGDLESIALLDKSLAEVWFEDT